MKRRHLLSLLLASLLLLLLTGQASSQGVGFVVAQGNSGSNSWYIGGASGPHLLNNSGALEARGASALAIVRAADPLAGTDLATKEYVDAIGKGNVLTFQPSGTAGGTVFTSWSSLFTAASAINGPVIIFMDGTHTSGAVTIPSGTWAFPNPDVVWTAAWNVPFSPADSTEVHLATGAVVSGVARWENMGLINDSTTTTPFTFSGGAFQSIEFVESFMQASGAAPLFAMVSGANVQIGTVGAADFGDGTNAVVHVDATSTLGISADLDATLETNSITVATGGTASFDVFSVSASNNIPSVVPNSLFTFASNLGYSDTVTPTLGATNVQAAIDALKTRGPIGSAGGSLAGTYPNPTIAASGVTAATYGSATQVPVCAVATDGRITSCTNTTITAPLGSATGTLGVGNGGTGSTSLTAHGALIGEGTSAVSSVVLGDAQLLVGQTSADPAAKTVSGDATLADTGACTVTGLQGHPVQTGAPASGNALVWSGSQWVHTGPNNDLGGTYLATTVNAISGPSPIGITPAVLEWTTGTVAPELTQVGQGTDTPTNTIGIFGQNAFSSATTNKNGGGVVVKGGVPASGGVSGAATIEDWNAADFVRASASGVQLSCSGGPVLISSTAVTIDSSMASPSWSQATAASGTNGQQWTFTAQNGGAGNTNGGSIVLKGGALSGGGTAGAAEIQAGDTSSAIAAGPNQALGASGLEQDTLVYDGTGTHNSQADALDRFSFNCQITSSGGTCQGTTRNTALGAGHSATIKCHGIARIVTAGTGTSVGDSYAAEADNLWKNVGGTLSNLGDLGAANQPLRNGSTSFSASGSAAAAFFSGNVPGCLMLLTTTSGTLGTADVTMWGEIYYN